MKAIVLTYDRYRALTEHMIFKYGQVWPDHPFVFRVPYQELAPSKNDGRLEFRKTPSEIKSTVLTLLEDLDDEEMVYWCIDDKYPIRINTNRANRIYQWLNEPESGTISGVIFCRCRSLWDRRNLTGSKIRDTNGNVYLERTGYRQIWLHQFLRVKVLRHLFESLPDVIEDAKSMDYLKSGIRKPDSHRIFVSRTNAASFGESTTRGVITRNCFKSILKHGLSLPEWCDGETDREIKIGTFSENSKRQLRQLVSGIIGNRR